MDGFNELPNSQPKAEEDFGRLPNSVEYTYTTAIRGQDGEESQGSK